MKIKSFGNEKPVKILKGYNGLTFDSSHVLARQGVVALKTGISDDELSFKSIERYVKIYESIEEMESKVENIIPRRLTLKKRLPKKKSKK
jgi:hypothetical protein